MGTSWHWPLFDTCMSLWLVWYYFLLIWHYIAFEPTSWPTRSTLSIPATNDPSQLNAVKLWPNTVASQPNTITSKLNAMASQLHTVVLQPNAVASSSKPVIDISLLDILDDNKDIKAKLPQRHAPAVKVGGSHCPSGPDLKGKRKACSIDMSSNGMKWKTSQLNDRDAKKLWGGCTLGVANYASDDVDALFDILEVWLPIGVKGWASVKEEFASWAKLNGWPLWLAKSLETKFKQVWSCSYINAMYSDFFHSLLESLNPQVMLSAHHR